MDRHAELRLGLVEELERQGADAAARALRECGYWARPLRCYSPCARTRVAVPLFCRRRICPTCAPKSAGRVREQLERRIRYCLERQPRQGVRPMLVTVTIRTVRAVLLRQARAKPAHPCGEPGQPFSPFVRWFDRASAKLLREFHPGQPVGEPDGTRRRRARVGVGGASALEVGASCNLHKHALALGHFYPSSDYWQRWRQLSRYRACGQCGSFTPGARAADCPDALCPRFGKPLELVESSVVDVRAVRKPRRAIDYVLKYVAKPCSSEDLADVARLEWLLQGVRRIKTWGCLYGLKESELEAAGYGREKPPALLCPDCGERLHTEETMLSAWRYRVPLEHLTARAPPGQEYELVGAFRRRMRKAEAA